MSLQHPNTARPPRNDADGAGRWSDVLRSSDQILQRRFACFTMTRKLALVHQPSVAQANQVIQFPITFTTAVEPGIRSCVIGS
jgi:hypothetical protein